MLRIALPRDVPLEVEGRLVRSFGALEFGGLTIRSADLNVKEGGLKVSFLEPLPKPMESLRILGDRGSMSIVGLGNASPRKTRLVQHIGAVDLDLRGNWTRDAEVTLIGGFAGGSLWLPSNVRVRGIDEHRGIRLEQDPEVPLPTLDLSISENMGRFIVMN